MPSRIDDLDLGANAEATSTDPIISKLGGPSFDAVSFLNDSLPVLNISSTQQPTPKGSKVSQIQHASSQLQILLNKVNTQHIRSSSQLTQVTDDILRSGSRLAYEVEVLRGDANGLYEVLTDTLKGDIHQFVAEQVVSDNENGVENGSPKGTRDPDFIIQLRMLGQVKARLEAVVNIFGEAMEWPLPGSEVSVASSLISVSAPELAGMETTDQDETGKETARKLRAEITDLVDNDGGGSAGLEAASRKVEELRLLCTLWKGTAEERAREKFVESLSKLVDDRKKILDARSLPQRARADSATQRSSSMPGRAGARSERNAPSESGNPAGGLFRNLQKLRDEIYLD
jgi:hypothetical protein